MDKSAREVSASSHQTRLRLAWLATVAVALLVASSVGRMALAGGSGKLIVEVSGFHSDQGQLLLRIYDHEAGFPTDGTKALRELRQHIEHGRATLMLAGLPFGSYAIGCVHDENGNGKLDTNLLGIPREGVCASRDARGRMGPPKWNDARFEFASDGATIRIHVAY
jgi:uncharacterized protein (DUF2141 family)